MPIRPKWVRDLAGFVRPSSLVRSWLSLPACIRPTSVLKLALHARSLSQLFAGYYLIYANEADEKVCSQLPAWMSRAIVHPR